MKLKAKTLRSITPGETERKKIKKNPIYIILDNVLDTYNIGAIFRLADAVSASRVLLCGNTETPPNSRIKKSSINTTEWVDWEYYPETIEAINTLRKEVKHISVVAIEQDAKSLPFQSAKYQFPIALVVGHETHGITQGVLSICDSVVELPMWGVNTSLNVMVSLGIVLFKVMEVNTT